MGELTALPNIGKELERQLNEIGIHTPQQLRETGSKAAWLQIQSRDPSACMNRLSGLEGAIQNIRWHNLDDATKADLKAFYQQHRAVFGKKD